MRPVGVSLLLALLAACSACCACTQIAANMSARFPDDEPNLAPVAAAAVLPPPLALHSTACLLGSWCPAHEHAQLHDWSAGNNLESGRIGGNSSQPSGLAEALPRAVQGLHHKPLWPLSWWDVAGISVAAMALLLAASGGIGGGAILVPLYLMVLGFSTSGAVALSNITIMGGTLANLAFNIGREHPLRQAPLIDWDLILVMEPSTILGALAGGYLNKLLPGWMTTVILSVLLSYISYKMASKAAQIRLKELRALQRCQEDISPPRRPAGHATQGGSWQGEDPSSLLRPLLASEEGAGGPDSPGPDGRVHVAAVSDDVRSSATPSPVGPLAVRSGSAGSTSAADGEAAGADHTSHGSSSFVRALVEAATAENGSSRPGGSSSDEACCEPGQQPPSSGPVPIGGGGGAGSDVLPLLTPLDEPRETQLDLEANGTHAQHPDAPPLGSSANPAKPWQHPALKGQPALQGAAHGSSSSRGGSGAKPAWRLHVPWAKVGILLALLAGVVVSDLLKLQAACPSLSYWLRATAMVPVTLATLFAVRVYLLSKGKKQRAAGVEAVEGDVAWSPYTTLVYPALCTFAGVCAGVFGVGGGIIKGPLMLEMGVLPEVAAATSASMILFTSSAASVVFVSFGAVQWDYAAALFTLGLFATVAGQLMVMWVQRHVQSRSILVIVMAVVLAISSFTLAMQGGTATVAAARTHALFEFHDVCGHAS